MTPIDLVVEERFHRAAPGGMGGTKAAGNYSPVSAFLFFLLLLPVGTTHMAAQLCLENIYMMHSHKADVTVAH